jgi:hypothetical protein
VEGLADHGRAARAASRASWILIGALVLETACVREGERFDSAG